MLKDKCINFERSMNEVCMTMNHNTDVTASYLYLTYGGTDYGESDDFRHIKPSEQLGKLELEELKDEDYIDIINDFIKNVKENVMIINHNTELLRTWLHDYDPDTEGHEYIDIMFDMKEIEGEKTSEELEEIFDTLMEKVKREIIPINCNIEMLIERF
jgi:hypothetical protein